MYIVGYVIFSYHLPSIMETVGLSFICYSDITVYEHDPWFIDMLIGSYTARDCGFCGLGLRTLVALWCEDKSSLWSSCDWEHIILVITLWGEDTLWWVKPNEPSRYISNSNPSLGRPSLGASLTEPHIQQLHPPLHSGLYTVNDSSVYSVWH